MRLLAAIPVVLALAAPAFAQDETAKRQGIEIAARVPLEKAVTGAPYSADVVIESNQLLADGTHISRKTSGKVYRDSEGRTRREQDGAWSIVSTAEPMIPTKTRMISITDPAGGYSYSLDPEHKIAWRTPLGTSGMMLQKLEAAQQKAAREREMVVAARGRSGGEPPRGPGGSLEPLRARGMATEAEPAPLEHKTIEGVAVEGRKRTTVLPVGAVGNDQPLTITSEEWRSPDLNVLVMTHHSDPRTGESSYRLTNIVRAEPDKSLFIVPPDYTVKDTGIRRDNN
jgi:hypothetical protein